MPRQPDLPKRFRLGADLRDILEMSGMPWDLRHGKRHVHLWVGGRLVVVLPKQGGRDSGRTPGNVLAAVRRAIHDLTHSPVTMDGGAK